MLQPPLSSARRVHGLVLIGPIHDTRARREAVLDALHCACRPGPASGLAPPSGLGHAGAVSGGTAYAGDGARPRGDGAYSRPGDPGGGRLGRTHEPAVLALPPARHRTVTPGPSTFCAPAAAHGCRRGGGTSGVGGGRGRLLRPPHRRRRLCEFPAPAHVLPVYAGAPGP